MKIVFGCFTLLLSMFCFFCSNAYAVKLDGVTVTNSSLTKSPGVQGGVINISNGSHSVSSSKGFKIISTRIEKSPGVQGGVIDVPVVAPQSASARAYAPSKHVYVNNITILQSSHYFDITNNTNTTQKYSIVLKLQRANGQYIDYKVSVQVDPNRSYYGQKDLYMNNVIYTQAGTYDVYADTDISGESSDSAKDTGHVTVSNPSLSIIKRK